MTHLSQEAGERMLDPEFKLAFVGPWDKQKTGSVIDLLMFLRKTGSADIGWIYPNTPEGVNGGRLTGFEYKKRGRS